MRATTSSRQATPVQHLLDDQAGVVARRQLSSAGLQDHDIRRLVRRRELVPIHPGVFVNHTGEPTWIQRAWAAVLYAWPAALCGESAVRATDGPGRTHRRDDDIHVAVAHGRRVRGRPGLTIERRRALDPAVLWNLGPPRVRYEEAVIDVALAAVTDTDAIATLASACGGRRTTAARLAAAAANRRRLPRRAWIEAVLRDVAQGTCSVLEHGYLDRVERAHGLPTARRQLRALAASGTVYRDAEIAEFLVIELDGRLFHDSTLDRDGNLERDLDASLDGRTTVRLGWGQVLDRPCSTAGKLARLLASKGWDGHIHPCGAGCTSLG